MTDLRVAIQAAAGDAARGCDNHSVFYEADAVSLTAVSFLRNLHYDRIPSND